MAPVRSRRSTRLLLLLAIATVLVAAGCGAGGSTDRRDRSTGPATAPAAREAAAPARTAAPTCSAGTPLPRLPAAAPAATRRIVDAAARRATGTGHGFRTVLVIESGTLRARATLTGRRRADGSSSGTLRWQGVSSLVLDDQQLRIIEDAISVRVAGDERAPWEVRGSAAGVALDVGRELLMHPQLLRARTAASGGGAATVDYVAPVDDLRAYATTERRGPVTDLLRATRRLTMSATARDGRLASDRFALATTVSTSVARGPIRAGAPITIRGATTYCATPPSG